MLRPSPSVNRDGWRVAAHDEHLGVLAWALHSSAPLLVFLSMKNADWTYTPIYLHYRPEGL